MNNEWPLIQEAATHIRDEICGNQSPGVGIILGTGLGELAREMTVSRSVDYDTIPNFPVSTVESHHGKLLCGSLSGIPLLAMQGRFHVYEGYSMTEIVRPVRTMKLLGINTLLVSNACGALNPQYRAGDLMLMEDHINLLGDNPLRGENISELGTRFPDMSEAYSVRLRAVARRVAQREGIRLQEGVYAAMSGPNLETRAEYRFLRQIGADVIGMSTIPEVIAARHAGMEVMGISVLTDECFPDALKKVELPQILAVAGRAEPKLTRIMRGVIEALSESTERQI